MARFTNISCSQCGNDFGPGDSGFSHCDQHVSIGWNRKETWRKWGDGFMVEISRHEEPVHDDSSMYGGEGPHRWCVYAYVYPKHPHFADFDGTEAMWQAAATALPFHGGPSFCRKHLNAAGEVTSYQVGGDYNHLHDTHFTQYATPAQASDVFEDAQTLFNVLKTRSEVLA